MPRPTRPGMGDYGEGPRGNILPATGFQQPMGPAQFPASVSAPKTNGELLADIRKGIAALNQGMKPHIRAAAITGTTPQTLDWSHVGLMKRLMIQNLGASTAFIAFDIEGKSVDAFVSDLSWQIPANGAITIPRVLFRKIGCKCAGTGTATVQAIAFQEDAGDFAGTVG